MGLDDITVSREHGLGPAASFPLGGKAREAEKGQPGMGGGDLERNTQMLLLGQWRGVHA